jgi:hypothetical protein
MFGEFEAAISFFEGLPAVAGGLFLRRVPHPSVLRVRVFPLVTYNARLISANSRHTREKSQYEELYQA